MGSAAENLRGSYRDDPMLGSKPPMRSKLMRNAIIGFVAFILLMFLILGNFIWENNQSGFIQVKQAATSGELSVRTTPGMYYQGFATVTDYKMSDVYDFTEMKIPVKFNDGSTATIGGQAQFRMPLVDQEVLKIHRDFRSYGAVVNNLVKRVVQSALIQSANLFKAEEVYSTRRSDFIDLTTDQIRLGMYKTTWTQDYVKDPESEKDVFVKRVELMRDKAGDPVVNDVSAFKIYNVELVGQVLINNIDFDDMTDGLIAKRKEAEQNQVVARANAERAKQDAITAMEEGKRDIAKAEAIALVDAKKSIVEAEKNTKIAMQKALQAEEEKKATIARGEADAAATKLKVAAGLSPVEAAEFEMKTAIGVADKLSNIKLPEIFVSGGGGTNGAGPLNPFDAVGLKSFIDMSKDMAAGKQAKQQ